MTVREIKHTAACEKWTRRITECRQSGLTVSEWCEKQEINKSTYYKWEHRLLKCAGTQSENGMVEVSSTPVVPFVEVPSLSAAQNSPTKLMDTVAKIHVGGLSIDLSNHTSPELLEFLKDVITGAG